jgi:hypothetical protein
MDTDQTDEIVKNLNRWAHHEIGGKIVDAKDFFKGLKELYFDVTLDDVVAEELPRIMSADPNFFRKNDIELPESHEVRLFDLYWEKYGRKGLVASNHKGKVWFRHMRYFLAEKPNVKELTNAISEYKKVMDGTCLD